MGITRRRFLGWLGAGAGSTVLIGRQAAAASNKQYSGYPGSVGVLHDTTRCIGCRKCEEACNAVNELPAPELPFSDLLILNQQRRTDPRTYTVVNRFGGVKPSQPVFVKTQCNHCLEPACASVCFVKALRKVKTGAVTYDPSLCVGCRYCMIACPFNIPTYEYDEQFTPRVMKCTLCQPRLEKGLAPGCVEACPKEALSFGPRDRLLKMARDRIGKYPRRYVDHVYGEHEMGGTSWLYLSQMPFAEIGMREDLGIQPASQFTAGPLSAVPVVVALWPVLLTGVYAISRRKDKVAEEERLKAIAIEKERLDQMMKEKMAALKDSMNKEKEAAINLEVKRALEEAAQKAKADQQPSADEPPAENPKEEN